MQSSFATYATCCEVECVTTTKNSLAGHKKSFICTIAPEKYVNHLET